MVLPRWPDQIFGGQKWPATTDLRQPANRIMEYGKLTGLGASGNVYAELGLTTVINAHLHGDGY